MSVLSDKWIRKWLRKKNDSSICIKASQKGKNFFLVYHHMDMMLGFRMSLKYLLM